MSASDEDQANLARSRELLQDLLERRLDHIDTVRHTRPLPTIVYLNLYRQTILRRQIELAEVGLTCLQDRKYAAGSLITRALLEGAAYLFYAFDNVAQIRNGDPNRPIAEKHLRLLLGSNHTDGIKPLHVMDAIRGLKKEAETLLRTYDRLSDMAHPNYSGAGGLFSQVDQSSGNMLFGHDLSHSGTASHCISSFCVAVGLTLVYFDVMSTPEIELPWIDPKQFEDQA